MFHVEHQNKDEIAKDVAMDNLIPNHSANNVKQTSLRSLSPDVESTGPPSVNSADVKTLGSDHLETKKLPNWHASFHANTARPIFRILAGIMAILFGLIAIYAGYYTWRDHGSWDFTIEMLCGFITFGTIAVLGRKGFFR